MPCHVLSVCVCVCVCTCVALICQMEEEVYKEKETLPTEFTTSQGEKAGMIITIEYRRTTPPPLPERQKAEN